MIGHHAPGLRTFVQQRPRPRQGERGGRDVLRHLRAVPGGRAEMSMPSAASGEPPGDSYGRRADRTSLIAPAPARPSARSSCPSSGRAGTGSGSGSGSGVPVTAAETVAVAALVSVSALLASSVKLTPTLTVVPWSAATSV